MDGLSCDKCGKALLLEEDVRYEVRIDVRAAYDPLELTSEDLARDRTAEIRELAASLARLSAADAQDQVHRALRFDLCPACQKTYLESPLGP